MSERRSRFVSWATSLLIASLAACATAQSAKAHPAEQPAIRNIYWQPDKIQQGSPVLFTVEVGRPAARVTGTFAGKRLTFFRVDKPREWYALAGIDLHVQPASYDLHVTALLRDGKAARFSKSVDVETANFGEGSIQVPEDYVTPNPEESKEIARDSLLKERAFAHLIPQRLWSGDFVKPVDAPSTPSFGETRLLNEEKTSLHLGTDFPVKEGSLVAASNTGTVVLATQLYYEGNCVIVDHGDRFFTIYMHLSQIDVRRGQLVRKGSPIGLSGATGRVTGPHFHLGVRWNGAYLDPVALLSLTLPELK